MRNVFPFIFTLWVVVVACVEIASTDVANMFGASFLLFLKHVVGLGMGVVTVLCMDRLWPIGSNNSRLPLFYWCLRLLSHRKGGISHEDCLFLGASVANVAALSFMYLAYATGGMAETYVFKSTEPLMTCILSTSCAAGVLGYAVPSDFLNKRSPPSVKHWSAIAMICAGSSLCSVALHGGMSASVGLGSCLIVLSNMCFGIRTVFQKVLLQEAGAYMNGSEEHHGEIVLKLFVNMSAVGAVLLLLPAWFTLPTMADLLRSAGVFERVLISGGGFFTIQLLNGYILTHLSAVSFSVAKQVRVMLIFLFSAYYFNVQFQHPWLGVGGGMCILLGTAMYSTSNRMDKGGDASHSLGGWCCTCSESAAEA